MLSALIRRSFSLASSQASIKVDKNLLSKLRKATGYPFINCRKALERFDNNYQLADEWLRSEAVKQGWAKAEKLASRSMSQGSVAVLLDQNKAVMVEVNCETDFVARNLKFMQLVAEVAETCWHHYPTSASQGATRYSWSVSALATLTNPGGTGVPLADQVAVTIGALGENVALRRAVGMATCGGSEGTSLACYAHSSWQDVDKVLGRVHVGKYAAVLRYGLMAPTANPEQEPASIAKFAQQVCQHIVGLHPRAIGRPGIDKPSSNPEEETLLLYQPFLLDPDSAGETGRSVAEHLAHRGMAVHEFVRFECGEEVETANETAA